MPRHDLGREAGAIQSGNTALLGALAVSGILPLGLDAIEAAIHKFLPEKIQAVNLKALNLGAEFMMK